MSLEMRVESLFNKYRPALDCPLMLHSELLVFRRLREVVGASAGGEADDMTAAPWDRRKDA